METKLFEVRDTATFIPVLAVQIEFSNADWRERYLCRRAGYGPDHSPPLVIVCRLEASGVDRNATYDPFAWCADNGTRTLCEAHQYIAAHWYELRSGDVIDVQFILGETKEPKKSEQTL